ncbi:Protein FAR-RED IMPAIRED RESPONSE 1, partial [Cucurbita argyrosperma subsp. argyrosperma]
MEPPHDASYYVNQQSIQGLVSLAMGQLNTIAASQDGFSGAQHNGIHALVDYRPATSYSYSFTGLATFKICPASWQYLRTYLMKQ